MMKRGLFFCFSLLSTYCSFGQGGETPNYANSAQQTPSAAMASKMSDATINLFTGLPILSVPIHNYKSNSGIGMSISLEYNGGGVQVAESPTTVGLSWFLSAGGTITRTVKGLPDDMPNDGYLYAGSIPTDWRANDSKYYNDSLDAAPDIFQFSYPGGSGRFFLGKNGQILVSPTSKIKVIPAFRTPDIILPTTLKSFRVVAEDGVKYDFEEADYTWYAQDNSYFPPGFPYTYSAYEGKYYPVVWYLTRIISPFYSDTIKLNYQTAGGGEYSFKFPQITYVNNSNGTRVNPTSAPGYGGGGSKKISSIEFPDKTTVSFVYSYNTKYSHNDYALSKIKVSDTAFRFGYLLDYQISNTFMLNGHPHIDSTRLLLKSVTPYTKNEKQEGYKFDYNSPLLPKLGDGNDTIQNKRDYWGYYNGAVNGQNLIPNVNGYTWGADRSPNNNALANSLSKVYLPTGGYMLYYYALNDHFPYTKQANQLSIAPATNTQNNITLNQVFNTKHQLQFFLDKSVSRSGSAPLSGSGMLNLYIKSTDGSVTYLSSSISLFDLFYSGLRTWTFNLTNGTYRLETSLSSGSGISGSFPVNINWENKNTDNSQNYNLAGGIRVTSISKQYSGIAGTSSFTIYNYIREDGKSSGFLGDIPRYDYPYRVVVNNTGAITDYTAVSSEPVSPTDYAQGSPVGYSRVEVVTSSLAGNLGKEVYEFTDLKDVNGNGFSNVFPYIPNDTRSWGLGLPKRTSVYDSSGALVKRTVNTYQFDTVINTSSNFKSIKLGHSQTNYSSDPNYPPVTKKKTFIGHEYYPLTGKAYLVYSADTLFQPNGSVNTSWQQLYYDTNYNVTKVVTSYDRNRNLVKEQRMYYPYNYTVGGGIGKMRDSAIISQMVATETWVTGDGNPRILSGAVTSFRQIANGELKPDTIYSFESNKPVVQATISVFDPAKLNRNTTYFKAQNYFTTYDTKGSLTEMKNLVSGRSNSTILDYDQKYPIANISNATQADIAYTSFEAAGTGNWSVGSTQRDLTYNLTGKKSYNLSNGNITKTGLSSSQSYLLTVWVKSGASASVNSTSLTTSIATQNNWNLYSVSLTGITSVTVSGSGLIDELRLHPKDANMATSAYEPMIGVISIADANNTVSYTEYDKLNRVKLIRDKDKNIVKRYDYSDSTMLVSTAPVWQGFDKRCSPIFPGQVDSAYRDMNIFSDSSGYVKYIYQGYLDCSCAEVQGNPQYAVINGTCEIGIWKVVSSIYKKVLINGFLEWRWVCTYKWCFSNGTTTSYFNETYNMSSCTVTCGSSTD